VKENDRTGGRTIPTVSGEIEEGGKQFEGKGKKKKKGGELRLFSGGRGKKKKGEIPVTCFLGQRTSGGTKLTGTRKNRANNWLRKGEGPSTTPKRKKRAKWDVPDPEG